MDNLFLMEVFRANRALAGEPVCVVPLMPNGFVRFGRRYPPIDEAKLKQIAANFSRRGESGFYQTLVPVNLEHDELSGAVGEVGEMSVMPDGNYAPLRFTPEGRQRLEAGQFSYLSPEIRWQTVDIETGEDIGSTLAGLALTNYPFFGDRVALYSQQVSDGLLGFVSGDGPELNYLEKIVQYVLGIGWDLEDLRFMADGPEANTQAIWSVIDAGWPLLSSAAHRRPFLEHFIATRKGELNRRYPHSAFALAPGPEAATWGMQIRRYDDNGRLVVDEDLVRACYGDLPKIPDDVRGQVRTAILEAAGGIGLGVEQLESGATTGGITMPGNDQDTPSTGSGEEFSALQEQLATMRSELDTYRSAIEERDAVITTQGATIDHLQSERLMDRFTAQAQGYVALGAEIPELASHLVWLYRADGTDGQVHLAYFTELLRAADEAMRDSEAFREIGTSRQPESGDVFSSVQTRVAAAAERMGVVAPPGSDQYQQVLAQVFAEDPELYNRYRSSVLGAG